MFQTRLRWHTAVSFALMVGAAGAQAQMQAPAPVAAPPAQRDPLNAQAPVPLASPPQALQGYQPYAEVSPVPWREANDEVGRIGGWRTYLREAQSAPAAPTAPAARAAPALAAPASAPAGHGAHKAHTAK